MKRVGGDNWVDGMINIEHRTEQYENPKFGTRVLRREEEGGNEELKLASPSSQASFACGKFSLLG